MPTEEIENKSDQEKEQPEGASASLPEEMSSQEVWVKFMDVANAVKDGQQKLIMHFGRTKNEGIRNAIGNSLNRLSEAIMWAKQIHEMAYQKEHASDIAEAKMSGQTN